jgi:alkylhydroperoxidase family enzyme
MVGLSKEQIEGLGSYKESSAYSDLEKTAISFAEQFTRDARVDEGTMKKLKDGLGEANLVKLAATVAMANWTNRFNNTFKPELP